MPGQPSPERDSRPDRPRIFGIGFNKTGTSSLHEALTILGYESLHWGGPLIRGKVEAALAAGLPLLATLDPGLDAFSDIEPLTRNFDVLDEQYPGSRFVLTVRPVDAWLESRRRHVERNVARRAAGEYHGAFLVVEEDRWRDDWEHHLRRVRRHFANRENLLEVDLTGGGSWDELCGFLSVPVPEHPFPWANRRSN